MRVSEIYTAVSEAVPGVMMEIDEPKEKKTGMTFLDFRRGSRHVVCQLKDDKYGVSLLTGDTGFGEGPDEVFEDGNTAVQKIISLLK